MSSYPERPGFKGDPNGPGADGARYYAGQVKGRRLQALSALDRGPATAEQISEQIGVHWYLIRPRLSELKALGFVTETGERGRGALGGQATVWRQLTPEERAVWLARQEADLEARREAA